MNKIGWVCGCILNLPLDVIRLTVHSWQISLEWMANLLWGKEREQRCPFCRDCDQSVVPRSMHREIRYWNVWLIRLLLPHLKEFTSRKYTRRIPYCNNDTGYIHNPWQAVVLAILLTAGWLALFVWLVFITA